MNENEIECPFEILDFNDKLNLTGIAIQGVDRVGKAVAEDSYRSIRDPKILQKDKDKHGNEYANWGCLLSLASDMGKNTKAYNPYAEGNIRSDQGEQLRTVGEKLQETLGDYADYLDGIGESIPDKLIPDHTFKNMLKVILTSEKGYNLLNNEFLKLEGAKKLSKEEIEEIISHFSLEFNNGTFEGYGIPTLRGGVVSVFSTILRDVANYVPKRNSYVIDVVNNTY